MYIHFIGIGGIGVSALAQYYLDKGHQVSGSDLNESEMTELLKKKGARVFIGKHNAENLKNIATAKKLQKEQLVVYSPAVQDDNPELKAARQQGIGCQSYPEALGQLTKKYFTIAVCGTHGKSTTTAMIALILIKAGLDPTVIIGTKLKEFSASPDGDTGSNFRMGGKPKTNLTRRLLQGRNLLVIEADEWQASFLNYWPKIIVLTNIEREHLDYYKDLEHIGKTYQEFINHLPKDGVLIDGREYRIDQTERKKLKQVLKIPGEHNIFNACLALSVSRYLEIPDKIAYKTLSEYQGAWRRFEVKELRIEDYKLKILSDYGHHPTEIKATLAAIKEKWPKKQVWLVFQPHQEQRSFYLFDDFVKVFKRKRVDKVIITDIYDVAGRENKQIRQKISAKKLVEAINKPNVIYLKKAQIYGYLKQNLKASKVDILVIMGAGDIYKLSKELST